MGFYGNATYYLPNGIAQNVVDGVITTKKLATDAVTASKIADTAIHGKGNTSEWQHIAKESIAGGENGDIAENTITNYNIAPGTIEQYNMADNSIGTDQIINGNITSEKLDKIYWSSSKKSEHIVENFAELLEVLPYDFAFDGQPSLSLIYINNISSENWANVKPIFPKGWYISLRNYGAINLIGYRGNQGANYELKLIKDENGNMTISSQTHHKIAGGEYGNIINDTITGGSAIGEGNIAGGTIQGYNINTNTIKGSYKAPGEEDMSSSHLGEYTIGRTNLGNKIITANKVADTAIHGRGNSSEWQHIASKSIAGGENGDIALNTITGGSVAGEGNIAKDTVTNYNIKPGTIENDRLSDKYYSYINAIGQQNLSNLIDLLNNVRTDQKVYFGVSPNGDLQNIYKLLPGATYCAEYKKDWIIYPMSNDTTILSYYQLTSGNELLQIGIKIGNQFIDSYAISGSEGEGDSQIKSQSIGDADIAPSAIKSYHIDNDTIGKHHLTFDTSTCLDIGEINTLTILHSELKKYHNTSYLIYFEPTTALFSDLDATNRQGYYVAENLPSENEPFQWLIRNGQRCWLFEYGNNENSKSLSRLQINFKDIPNNYIFIERIEETLTSNNFNDIIYPIFNKNKQAIVEAYISNSNKTATGQTIMFLVKSNLYIMELNTNQLWKMSFSDNMDISSMNQISTLEHFDHPTVYNLATNTYTIELNDSHIFELENSYSTSGSSMPPILNLNAYNSYFTNSCKIYFQNYTDTTITIKADQSIKYMIEGKDSPVQIGYNNDKEIVIFTGGQGAFLFECSKGKSDLWCKISKFNEMN